MASLAAPTDDREALYARLMRRNRLVGLLRWLVPAAGVLAFVGLLAMIVIDNIGQRFGFSNIRIDRDNLVVETPKLTSTDDDGTLYALSARAARVRPSQTDMIDMEGVVFSMTPTTGPAVEAAAEAGQFQVNDQLLNVPGVTHISSTEGLKGTLEAVFADLMNWKMVASGTVDFTLPNGSHLVSDGMTYDRATGIYTFTRASVTLVSTPGETP
jgi:lipopolysaccharide export system protein LptC